MRLVRAPLLAAPYATKFRVAGTCHQVIVDHASRLHQRVADGGAHEFEAASQQIAAHRVGLGCARWNVGHASPAILDWLATDEAPQVSVETPKLVSHGEKHLCVLDRGRNFQSIPHDPGVAE